VDVRATNEPGLEARPSQTERDEEATFELVRERLAARLLGK
jgi:hypothetical protein